MSAPRVGLDKRVGTGPRDLRELLSLLERNGQLVRVPQETMPEPDLRGYCGAVAGMKENGPAILFDNIKGYRGKRLAVNLQGSWANCALMCGLPKNSGVRELFFELNTRFENSAKGELVWVEKAPCQENVIKDSINLYQILPAFRINQYDGGFYLSKATVVSKDPRESRHLDTQSVGVYRMQLQSADTLGVQALACDDFGTHIQIAEELNQPLPVAICLGVPPAASLIAHARSSYHLSKYSLIAAVHQDCFELTTALTADLDVPAYSEYVLEGYVIPQARYPEGPLGDFPGVYSPLRKQPRIKITAVTHRTDPIMESSYLGRPWTEHDCLVGLTSSLSLYKEMRENVPQVVTFGGHAHSIGFRLAIAEAGSFAGQGKAEVKTIDVMPQVEAYRTLIRRYRHAHERYEKQPNLGQRS